MICELHLENFLFIRDSHLEFKNGLNVITGETGAGKSILLEAVKLLLGKKGKSGMVLPGAGTARIQACLNLSKAPEARKFLSDSGFINEDEEKSLIISRSFKAEGSEKIIVNGLMAPLALLKGLGVHLMEIHGQNEHQTLLESRTQRNLLDRTGGDAHRKRLAGLRELFQQRRKISEDLDSLQSRLAERESRLEELFETRKALDLLSLESPSEDRMLKEEENRLQHAEQIASAGSVCQTAFSGDDRAEGVTPLLYRARETMRKILPFDQRFRETCDRLESLYLEATDLQKEIERGHFDEDFQPDRLNFIRNRLADISRACRRYKTDCEGLFGMSKTVDREISELTSPDSTLEKKKAELASIEKKFSDLSIEISQERKRLGSKLEKAVAVEMGSLGFASAGFSINFPVCEPGPDGKETVEFMVSLNPGAPGGPLRKVASGGELSRVTLAIKKVLAKCDQMPTMVFDEIDSGIGGETAEAVSLSLKELGEEKQVLLVTHLHQIAKEGDRHFTVTKSVEENSTQVTIKEVSGQAREKEIARMLGATDSQGLTFARSILKEKKRHSGKFTEKFSPQRAQSAQRRTINEK